MNLLTLREFCMALFVAPEMPHKLQIHMYCAIQIRAIYHCKMGLTVKLPIGQSSVTLHVYLFFI